VIDRLIQQAVAQVIRPLFEEGFSPHSYGFRPGRRARDAVRAAQGYIREGYAWVVDVDLEKFFERVHHDKALAVPAERASLGVTGTSPWRMAASPVVNEGLSNAFWQKQGLRSITERYNQLRRA
jgi:hypothetical protein